MTKLYCLCLCMQINCIFLNIYDNVCNVGHICTEAVARTNLYNLAFFY